MNAVAPRSPLPLATLLATAFLGSTALHAQSDEKPAPEVPKDIADVHSYELHAGADANKRYFLLGFDPERKAPGEGYKLLLIMPGGGGGADFEYFCRRIWKNALDEDYVVAQLVSKKWTEEQQVVWPTDGLKVAEMEFSTEDFLAAVIEDVETRLPVDRSQIFTLSWSSSGPAAYAAALQKKSRITGSFIAMSVFKPDQLPPLQQGKNRPFFIMHSEGDRVCPMRMARDAEAKLTKAKATVEFHEYEGGHGWSRTIWSDMKKGIAFLEENHAKAMRAPKAKRVPAAEATVDRLEGEQAREADDKGKQDKENGGR